MQIIFNQCFAVCFDFRYLAERWKSSAFKGQSSISSPKVIETSKILNDYLPKTFQNQQQGACTKNHQTPEPSLSLTTSSLDHSDSGLRESFRKPPDRTDGRAPHWPVVPPTTRWDWPGTWTRAPPPGRPRCPLSSIRLHGQPADGDGPPPGEHGRRERRRTEAGRSDRSGRPINMAGTGPEQRTGSGRRLGMARRRCGAWEPTFAIAVVLEKLTDFSLQCFHYLTDDGIDVYL